MALRASEINLFKREKSAEEFLNLLPPDAQIIALPNGSTVIRQGGKTYNVPRGINNEVRALASNVSDLTGRTYLNTVGARDSGVTQEPNQSESQVTVDRGSDFLTNVGGPGATTFDYDLSDADLQEAIELRKAAYGVDTIESRTRISPDGTEEKGFFEKVGDKFVEVFKSPQGVVTEVSPVSGKTITTRVPALEGATNLAFLTSPFPGLGTAIGQIGENFVERQVEEAEKAAIGVKGFGTAQIQDLSTGQVIDLTASPTGNALTKALGLEGGSVGTYAEATAQGPFATPDGKIFSTLDEAANYVGSNRFTTKYGMERFIPAGETYDPTRVLDPGIKRIGEYDEDSGEVDLGFGRTGAVTGIAIDQEGNLHYKTGTGGFFMGMGEMVGTGSGTGIGYSGNRADIARGKDISVLEATNLLNKIDDGTITSTPNTTEFLQNIVGYDDTGLQPTTTGYNVPLGNYFEVEGMGNYNTPTYTNINYGDVIKEQLDPPYASWEDYIMDKPTTNLQRGPDVSIVGDDEIFDTPYNPVAIDSAFYKEDDGGSYKSSSSSSYPATVNIQDQIGMGGGDTSGIYEIGEGGTYAFSETPTTDVYSEDDSYFTDPSTEFELKEGGRVGKQEGGTTVKPVSQIVQGAGFIAPQNNATEEQTIADDIPMEAEEGDFIINAPAAQFAGRQDIVTMIVGAIESLREKGVDIQYGNPKIPIKRRVQLAVSRNEVYVPKVVAEEIGYDKLEKINNRGKKEVEQRQQEAQQQANRGGFVKKAGGDVVDDKSSIIGTDEGNFLQDLGRIVVKELGDKLKGFLSKEETPEIESLPEPRPENVSKKEQESQDLQKQEKKPIPKEYEPQTEFQKLVYQALENIEKPKKSKNEAYIPDGYAIPEYKGKPFKNSGATIGLGVDLGQYSPIEWKAIGLNEDLFNKIKPYILDGHLQKGLSGLATNKDKVHGSGGLRLLKEQPLILNNVELAELNSKIFNYKFDRFEKKHGSDYKDFNNPEDKVTAFVMDWGGAFNNPLTFKQVLKETLDTETALERGFINNKNISSTGLEASRAKRLLGWYKRYRDNKSKNMEITPKPKPKEIQANPDNRSFLSPQISV